MCVFSYCTTWVCCDSVSGRHSINWIKSWIRLAIKSFTVYFSLCVDLVLVSHEDVVTQLAADTQSTESSLGLDWPSSQFRSFLLMFGFCSCNTWGCCDSVSGIHYRPKVSSAFKHTFVFDIFFLTSHPSLHGDPWSSVCVAVLNSALCGVCVPLARLSGAADDGEEEEVGGWRPRPLSPSSWYMYM